MNYDAIIKETAAAIKQGDLILYPTDTIWGMGCDAKNEEAVQKLYQAKELEKEQPLILLVSTIEMLKDHIVDIHPRIETLLFYNSRPLSLIYKQAKNLPLISVSADLSVAIRVVQEPFCKALIEEFGGPITSTSANISHQEIPTKFEEVSELVKERVDYIVPYRQSDTDVQESSVLATYSKEGELIVLRS